MLCQCHDLPADLHSGDYDCDWGRYGDYILKMKPNTCLVVDVWEGSLEIDEGILKAAGVAGFVVRLNDMNGGHHMDGTFAAQWAQAASFARCPYFVYNPWVSGQANFDWLSANIPAECRSVMVDVEVRYAGYSPTTYAGEVAKFMTLAQSKWRTAIYTGAGFSDLLMYWPACEYWWAQYPGYDWGSVKTWDQLKAVLDAYYVPYNRSSMPIGILRMWQFSGDKLILPGTIRTTDVNIFYGTEAELRAWWGCEVAQSPGPVTGLDARVADLERRVNLLKEI